MNTNLKCQVVGKDVPKSSRMTITIANGSTFSGVLQSLDEAAGKIILKNVTTSGVKLFGPQIYYCKDMIDLEVTGDFQEMSGAAKSPSKAKRSTGGVQFKKRTPAHLSKLKNVDTDDLLLSNIFRDELKDLGIGSEDDDFDDYYETDDYTMICRVSDKFYDAIEYIMKQEAVGVVVDGQNIGRDGILSMIQVSTEKDLIVFDMLRLGDEGFKSGLQAMFESSTLLKVMHDCRYIADMLQSQQNITMANIFDTQVANVFVYRGQNCGMFPRYVESLPSCLVNYLNLHHADVFFMKVRERSMEDDETVLLHRPLPERLLTTVIKNTKYMLPLYRALLVAMLTEFKAGVDIYLNYLSKTGMDLEKCRKNSHLLPHAFSDFYNYVERPSFAKPRTKWQQESTRQDPRGFDENCVGHYDNTVVFSHDSAWHTNQWGNKGFNRCASSDVLDKSKMAAAPAEFRRIREQKPEPTSFNNNRTNSSSASALSASTPDNASRQGNINQEPQSLKSSSALAAQPPASSPEYQPTQNHTNSTQTRDCPKARPLTKSKLWQAMCLKDKNQSVSFPGSENEDTMPSLEKEPAQDIADRLSGLVTNDTGISSQDVVDEAEELKRKLAIFDQFNTFTSRNKQSSPSTKKLQFQKETQCGNVEQSLPKSSASSDNESCLSLADVMEAEMKKRGNNVGSSKKFALMPAGMNEGVMLSKKSQRKQQNQSYKSEDDEWTETQRQRSSMTSCDYSAIPAPHSYGRNVKSHLLGVSSIGIGDPFSEDEGFSTPSGKSRFNSNSLLSSSQRQAASNITDVDDDLTDNELNQVLESEKSQMILRMASSLRESKRVRDKLLPIPAKLKSPSSGSGPRH